MKKNWFYAVKDTAVFTCWEACEAVVSGKPLQHHKFATLDEALAFKGEVTAPEYVLNVVSDLEGNFEVYAGSILLVKAQSRGKNHDTGIMSGVYNALNISAQRGIVPAFEACLVNQFMKYDVPAFKNMLLIPWYTVATIPADPVAEDDTVENEEDDEEMRRRFEAELSEFEPTKEQAEMMDKLSAFLSGSNPAMILSGCAGTGKTTLAIILAMIAWLKYGLTTLFVAPTNKAVYVLAGKADAKIKGIFGANTVHGALYSVNPKTMRCSYKGLLGRYLVICDESSMISDNKETAMISDLLRAAKETGSKVLFMGDPFQLPPVGEGKTLWQYGLPEHKLKKVMRQADGSNVLELATAIRYFGHPVCMNDNGHHGDIHQIISGLKPEPGVMDMITNYAIQWIKGDDIVGLAFTNKKRTSLNEKIREKLFEKGFLADLSKLQAGEALLSIANAKAIKVLNGESFKAETVEHIRSVKLVINVKREDRIVCETLDADLAIVNGKKTIFIADTGKSSSIYHSSVMNKQVLPADWLDEDSVADDVVIATYGYVITIHKSQGGQWERVYVFESTYRYDMEKRCLAEGGLEYAARGFYTAVTRASKSVVLSTSMIWDWWCRKADNQFDKTIWMKARNLESLSKIMDQYNAEQE